jgi:hypothetical protein
MRSTPGRVDDSPILQSRSGVSDVAYRAVVGVGVLGHELPGRGDVATAWRVG